MSLGVLVGRAEEPEVGGTAGFNDVVIECVEVVGGMAILRFELA